MRLKETLRKSFTEIALISAGAMAGVVVGDKVFELTGKDNQVNGIQLVDCSPLGLHSNSLNIRTLNNRSQPIHVGGQTNFFGVHKKSLGISPDQKGGISLEIPDSEEIERIKKADGEAILFHSRGVAYEITSAPVDQFSTSIEVKASCED
jgi:hypothetical protein